MLPILLFFAQLLLNLSDQSHVPKRPSNRRPVDPEKLDAACRAQGIETRREFYEQMEWDENTFNPRFSRQPLGRWSKKEIELTCGFLGCRPEDICVGEEPQSSAPLTSVSSIVVKENRPPTILDERDIEKIYRDIEADSFIWIFSADGFLEADEGEGQFFDVVSRALGKGIKISYFFPDSKSAAESHRAFAKIIQDFIRDHGPAITEKVKGFFILAEGGFLYAHSSRFVVFGKSPENGERIFQRVMLFIRSVSPRGGHWIEMGDLLRDNFRHRMKRAIDPIEHVPVVVAGRRWHLPSLVQERYRTSFDNANDRRYAVVRNLVNTQAAVANLAERVSQIVNRSDYKRRKPGLEWLDIGCEDGSNTLVAFNTFRSHDLPVSLTAIETSPQTEPLPILQHSVFLNGSEWGLEQFLEKAPRDYKYDIMTSVHSWYVIDPIYILSIFRLLQSDGVMAFIIAPYRNNIINKITGVVDGFIREKFRSRDASYPMKEVKEDPYRNFGEDVLIACRWFFGNDADAVKLLKRDNATIDTRKLLTTKGTLTSDGKAVAEFFAHGMIKMNDKIYAAVAEAIKASDVNGLLPCAEWDIIIDKGKIMTRGQERLFGGITAPD
jgi:hypothetical protein